MNTKKALWALRILMKAQTPCEPREKLCAPCGYKKLVIIN